MSGEIAGEAAVDPALRTDFLAAMRRVTAPVAIITTADGAARRGLVATAWTSLTADPPMVLACVNRTASAHDVIADTARFCVNVLAAEHRELVAIFSNQRGLAGDARFAEGAWMAGALGLPVLRDALASFECVLAECHDGRTHSILTGQVQAIRLREAAEGLLYRDGAIAVTGPCAG